MSLHQQLHKFEAAFERFAAPVKPYLPLIARFLLVVTFLEDSVRMTCSFWASFLNLGFSSAAADLFLIGNVLIMLACSILAIAKKHTEIAVGGLAVVVVTQGLGYGLIFDPAFLFRTISIVGGLVMLLADAHLSKSSKNSRSIFAGLPQIVDADSRSTYLQLCGRVLLVFLFLSFVFAAELTPLRIVVAAIALIGSILVVIGFKAKWTAGFLIVFLCFSNVLLNNWWTLHHNHPQRDFQRYDFFQNLSIMGGFLLLVNLGPGGLSMDGKKKDF
ncbi:hypothetical protein HK100_012363 [Physocladia obscura]|uniref:SURF4-domain-containing protein n=1 Tax=Physocladia obscura TaxID=109957 RepID=A0AAD5XGA6_9FUNG|nr:hypothetical protein HK100_012363 [Physocladia obscura]